MLSCKKKIRWIRFFHTRHYIESFLDRASPKFSVHGLTPVDIGTGVVDKMAQFVLIRQMSDPKFVDVTELFAEEISQREKVGHRHRIVHQMQLEHCTCTTEESTAWLRGNTSIGGHY